MKYECLINDAISNKKHLFKGRWVDCSIIEGEYNLMTNDPLAGHYPLISLMRGYWDKKLGIIEKRSEEKMIYKKEIRLKKRM